MAAIAFLFGTTVVAGGAWVYKNAAIETATGVVGTALDYTGPVGRWVRGTYSDYNAFKGLLQDSHSNPISLHWTMVRILAIRRYQQATNFIETTHDRMTHTRSTAVRVDPDNHRVEYYYNGRVYAVKVSTPARYEELVRVEDKNGTNVLKKILPYLGPAHDFHGQRYTPEELGYKSLTFSNGLDTLTFSADTPIVLEFPEFG